MGLTPYQKRRWKRRMWIVGKAFAFFTLIVLVSALVGILSLLVGYRMGLDDGISYTEGNEPRFNQYIPDNHNTTYIYVNETGTWTIDGYTINLVNESHSEVAGDTTGKTYMLDDMWIETNRSLSEIYTTCTHEIQHNLHPDAPHGWIYKYAEQIRDDTCIKLIYKIGSGDHN